MNTFRYEGDELGLFALAKNWKRYLRRQFRPFMGAQVLEVGAGIGAFTALYADYPVKRWLCLEPDSTLAPVIRGNFPGQMPTTHRISSCEIDHLTEEAPFDTLLYIDVLEHIAADKEQLASAVKHLEPKGHLIVLSPAHQWLFSDFDKAIGHVRRYTKKGLSTLTPAGTELVSLRYLDSVGFFASAANAFFLKQRMPTKKQILFWDRVLVRSSILLDPFLGYLAGKSVLAVWQKK